MKHQGRDRKKPMDAFVWAKDALEKLKAEFGEHLRFVGLQGSRARGEAREGSDIDLVVLLDDVGADSLELCRSIVRPDAGHRSRLRI